MGDVVRRTTAIDSKEFSCGGCVACDESSSGDALIETRMDLSDLGIVLCNGIGYVPGGGRPLAEVAAWECSRLLQLGLGAEDALLGAHKLISRVALLTESGWSTVLVLRFLADGELELSFSGDTIGFVVGKGTAKPLGEGQTQQGVVPAHLDDPEQHSHHLRNVHLDPGEWLCAMTGTAWKSMPLSCIARTCQDNAGSPSDAAAALVDAAESYGSRGDVAVAVVERSVAGGVAHDSGRAQ